MRISTSMMQQLSVDAILQQQTQLSNTENQLATGKQVLTAADNPVAASQMLSLQHTIDTTNQYQSNITSATNRLNFEDSVLQNTTNILQQIRTLAIEGNNATQTNQTRSYISSEIKQQLEQIVSQANSTDSTGAYLFSGSKGNVLPFTADSSGTYTYNGDQTQRYIQTGATTQVADSDPGSSVFQMIRNGNGTFYVQAGASNTGTSVVTSTSLTGAYTPSLPNGYTVTFSQATSSSPITYQVTDSTGTPLGAAQTYTDGQAISFDGVQLTITGTPADGDTYTVNSSKYQDLFTTVSQLASTLNTTVTSDAGQAKLNNEINSELTNLDQAMSSINTVQASIGTRLNSLSSQQSINSDQVLQTQSVLSSIQDLDYASAVSKLNMQTTGLQAAEQAYLRVQGLSLFSLLK